MVRHWHAVEDSSVKTRNVDQYDDSEYFVVVEGYIVPKVRGENGHITSYDVYLVDQATGQETQLTSTNGNPYISSIDTTQGTITLPVKIVNYIDNSPAEHFSGFSISAGHSAVDADINSQTESLKISYHENVHLVKAHVFYSNEKITVYGSGEDEAVFGVSTEQKDKEQDTAWVYTYKTNNGEHKIGDVVTSGTDNKPVFYGDSLPEGLTEGENVQKTKVYNTIEGLHTDKTASAVEGDNRKFNLDLESWYSGAPLADIGLVLDSSGSMGFTSDDLTPININNIGLSEENKAKLQAKELIASNYQTGPTNEQWLNNIFLKEEDINLMLNPHNTDNSKLGASDYSYFLFDPRKTVNEFVPLGYWDGSVVGVKDKLIGYYEFNKGEYGDDVTKRDWLKNSVNGESAKLVKQLKVNEINNNISFEEAQLPENWKTDKRISLDNSKGLNIKNSSELTDGQDPVGVLLDAKPTSGNFTISFSILKDSTDNNTNQKYVDIMYIGKESNSEGDNYYRTVRDGRDTGAVSGSGSSSNRFRGYNDSNESLKNKVTDINSVFSKTERQTITLVFENGNVTSYLNGNKSNDSQNTSINLSDYNIIFKGFDNDYDGADLFVDNIAVFDTALSESEVKEIEKIIKSENDKDYIVCNECFCNDNSESSIGVVSNYFVGLAGGEPGWYYVNYDSEWTNEYFNKDIQSCKRFWGIADVADNRLTFTDKVSSANNKEESTNTNFTYTAEKDTPPEFYIDSFGYLRCFFASSTKQETANASYVYFKDDTNYVKTEALQRAIGSFTTMLDEVSPDSKISAVKFSSDKIPEDQLDKLVLLDWTSDPVEAQDIMSLDRGEGGTVTGTPSDPTSQEMDKEPIQQYNYGLTGGTDTNTGLKSFSENLSSRADESADKYLIIFTDGKDSTNTDKQNESKTIADKLKTEGYTIFGVMLTGGSVEYSTEETSDYQQAKKFLLTLVGDSSTSQDSEKERYFYSTAEGENSKDNSIDALTKIFTDEILNRITYNLKNYTVEDYIDPRFDLVSADDITYHLNAEGKVSIKNSDGTTKEYDLKSSTTEVGSIGEVQTDEKSQKYLDINLSNSSKIEESAHNARLYYNSEKKMYYIKWVDQTIPGCIPNAEVLSVWNARITVKAKDDFIGGNAVLTNGNDEKENWVYYEDDTDKSSGTDDAFLKETESSTTSTSEPTLPQQNDTSGEGNSEENDDVYPSKGFPRTTVNVPPSNYEFSESQTIYMGESINQEELSKKLMEDTFNKHKDTSLYYYLEYLERYSEKDEPKTTLEQYKENLAKGEKVSIPYYYLSNSKNTNNSGTEEHEKDQLGTLEYQVTPECEEYCPEGGIIKDRKCRKLLFTVKYIPLAVNNNEELVGTNSNEVQELESTTTTNYRDNQNEGLIKDTNYKWNKEFKPVVGDELTEKKLIKGEHQTDEVSGEIAFQLVLTPDVQEVIGDEELTYSVDLMREYNGGEKKKVGTFTATYKKADIPQTEQNPTNPSEGVGNETTPEGDKTENKYEVDENGNVTILATLKYDEDYMTQNGLPIGTYTLGTPKITEFKNLKFDLPNVITDSLQYTPQLYSLGSDKENPQSHLASFKEDNIIVLGDKTNNTESTDNVYTNYRFGLLQVTPITYFELPETGKTSLIQFYVLITIFTITGIALQIKKKENNK